MNLKYTNWNQITIADYKCLQEIANSKDLDAVDTEIAIVGLLCKVDEEEILNLPVDEFTHLRTRAQFVAHFPEIRAQVPKRIELDGKEYDYVTDIKKMTTAQYIDFQTYYKMEDGMEKHLHNLLSCFIVPKGHIYGKDYDVEEVAQTIDEHMPIVEGLAFAFFMLRQYLSLTKAILSYSEQELKKAIRKAPKEKRDEIREARMKVRQLRLLLKSGLG